VDWSIATSAAAVDPVGRNANWFEKSSVTSDEVMAGTGIL